MFIPPFLFNILVPGTGIEPVQPQWPQDFKSCVSTSSTTQAGTKKLFAWADDRARTGHPDLGKVVLYQMSYIRF